MAEPTIIQDYVGHTYNYTHPTSGRLIKLHITPDMVGRPLSEVLDEADQKLAHKSPFAKLFDKIFNR
jgi:hypothetical protein